MTRTLSILILALSCGCVAAQAPETPDKKPAEAGIPADFNDYLRKVYPGLDPGGEHDIFALKDPKDEATRHDYTVAMTQMLLEYLTTLDMGSTIIKQFDQYSRGKEGGQATFKTLYALVLLYYPPGKPNSSEAQKLLHQAAEQAPDYAYPWFLLANFEFARFSQATDVSPRAVLAALDQAIELRPKFLRAVLMKCQVFLRAQPPRSAEVSALIAPFLKEKLPAPPDDFEDLLKMYWATHKTSELHSMIQGMLDGGKLSEDQVMRALRVKAQSQLADGAYDDGIATLEEMRKLNKPAEDPNDAIWIHRQLGAAWGTKAMKMKFADPELKQPGAREECAGYTSKAEVEHAACADIERKHLPLALRGSQARTYVEFLLHGMEKPDRARDWLVKYLEETDLAVAQRNLLNNLRRKIEIVLNPTEEGLLDMYEDYVASDDMDNLAVSLGVAVRTMNEKQEGFKTERALKFFLGQLDNRVRVTVGFAAVLAAEAAQHHSAESIRLAGEAVATRLEKEAELNSDEQSRLQAMLAESLLRLGHRPSQERAVRHAAKLIEASAGTDTIRTLMRRTLDVWTGDQFLKGLTNPPEAPRAMDKNNPTRAAAWLIKLADVLAKQEA